MGFIPFAQRKAEVQYRRVVYPVREILPACKNCSAFRCDHDDRMGFDGQLQLQLHRVNLRCGQFGFGVSLEAVCDKHQFRNADRSDV